MVKRYLSIKFDTNLLYGFQENGFYGRTTDGRPRDDSIALLCCAVCYGRYYSPPGSFE